MVAPALTLSRPSPSLVPVGLGYLASLRLAQVTGGGSPEPGAWTLTYMGSSKSKPSSVTLCNTVELDPSPFLSGSTSESGYSISLEAPCSGAECS